MTLRAAKTLARGLSKTRSGRPSISIQTLINRAKISGFGEEIFKLAVEAEEALDAARKLTQGKQRTQRLVAGGVIGAAASPVITATGDVAGALFSKNRKAGLLKAFAKNKQPRSLAKEVTRGILGGTGVQGLREGVDVHQAKSTVNRFLQESR